MLSGSAVANDSGAPFQILLELAARAQSGTEAAELQLKVQPHWTGVGFSVLGQQLVAPMAQVAEILMLPPASRLPRVQPWVTGVANVRGKLLPLVSLAAFLGGRAAANWRAHRALVVENDEMYCGLIVDEVFGLKHFATDAFRPEVVNVPDALSAFVEGTYGAGDAVWTVFRPDLVLMSPLFLDAARH